MNIMTRRAPMRLLATLLLAALSAVLPATASAQAGADPAMSPVAPIAAPAGCAYTEIASVPIRYVGPGMAPAIDGIIEGTPATMLVDTGAYLVQLTMNGVNRRNMALHRTQRTVRGFGGSSPVYTVQVRDFAVGPARVSRRLELDVIGEARLTPAFDAIVGSPFLLQSDLEIDLRAKRMRFFRPRDCAQTTLTPWPEQTFVIPYTRVPQRHPNPHFTVVVNGQKLDAVIDTGAHRTVMLLGAAKKAGIDVAGPQARRLGNVVGIGLDMAPYWSARAKTIEIGGATLRDAEIGIVDAQADLDADLYLGQDFLRAHRVLFAASQRKLYVAYLGGEVFSNAGLGPLIRAEAEGGNPDAQYSLATMYARRNKGEQDARQARAWLEKAAAGGEPHAILQIGRQLTLAGQLDDGIRQLRAALDQLPADRHGALWLYTARVRNGVPGLGKRELEDSLARQVPADEWPQPVARFYLGQIDAAGLLEIAGKERQLAATRTCEATRYMAELHDARGEAAQAADLKARAGAACGPAAREAAGP